MNSVTITYDLHPPKNVSVPGRGSTAEHKFTMAASPSTSGSHVAYYAALRETIATAKTTLGEELTIWRDAVGKKEIEKEKAKEKQAKADGDEEDLEEEEEEDGAP
jgi:hypothetical protein